MPRAGLGALAVPLLIVLERLGLFPGAEALARLRRRPAQASVGTSSIVRRQPGRAVWPDDIGRTVPIVYGGGGLGGLAAMRWKTQFNENAKVAGVRQPASRSCATTRSAGGASTAT